MAASLLWLVEKRLQQTNLLLEHSTDLYSAPGVLNSDPAQIRQYATNYSADAIPELTMLAEERCYMKATAPDVWDVSTYCDFARHGPRKWQFCGTASGITYFDPAFFGNKWKDRIKFVVTDLRELHIYIDDAKLIYEDFAYMHGLHERFYLLGLCDESIITTNIAFSWNYTGWPKKTVKKFLKIYEQDLPPLRHWIAIGDHIGWAIDWFLQHYGKPALLADLGSNRVFVTPKTAIILCEKFPEIKHLLIVDGKLSYKSLPLWQELATDSEMKIYGRIAYPYTVKKSQLSTWFNFYKKHHDVRKSGLLSSVLTAIACRFLRAKTTTLRRLTAVHFGERKHIIAALELVNLVAY